MLKKQFCWQKSVISLRRSGGDIRGRHQSEAGLKSLTKFSRYSCSKVCSEARASASTDGVGNEEALQPIALLSCLSDLLHHLVDVITTSGIAGLGIQIRGILISVKQIFWLVEVSKRAISYFVHGFSVKIYHDSSWLVMVSISFRKEGLSQRIDIMSIWN